MQRIKDNTNHTHKRKSKRERERQRFILVPLTNREYSSPLALPREFTIITKDYTCSSTQARDFLCSSNPYKRLPMLKHTSKRLQTTYKKNNKVYEHLIQKSMFKEYKYNSKTRLNLEF